MVTFREMDISDYNEVIALWATTERCFGWYRR
ncbi:N-acetyltransferase GCN5 [Vibrio cholerae]|nr:N-acetyltransferase GCN5 [Vibrio cholerae]